MRKVRNFLSICLILVCFIQPAWAVDNLDETPLSSIALFGDSIITGVQFSTGFTAFDGMGLEFFGCPPIFLRNILRNEGDRPLDFGPPPVPCPTTILNTPVRDRVERERQFRNSRVVNWGEGGSTTFVGVGRLARDLNNQSARFPNAAQRFVLIHYGTNDPGQGVSRSQTSFNLTRMVSQARSLGYTPALSTLLPRSGFDTEPLTNAIRGIGSSQNVPVVDMFNAFLNFPGSPSSAVRLAGRAGSQGGASNLLPIETFGIGGGVIVTTRLHPNDQGYVLMAERWFDEFLEDAIPAIRDITIAPIINLLLDE